MTFQSWAEAKATLDVVYAVQKAWGVYAGAKLLAEGKTIHSQLILDEMRALGVLDGYEGKFHWIGSVVDDLAKHYGLVECGRHYHEDKRSHKGRHNPIWKVGKRAVNMPDPPAQRPDYASLPKDVEVRERYLLTQAKALLRSIEHKLSFEDAFLVDNLLDDLEDYANDVKKAKKEKA